MPRKKAHKKEQQETALVPHRTPNLSALLERAKSGDAAQAVRAYIDAGGSMTARAPFIVLTGVHQISLLHAMVCLNAHPHRELAESVRLLAAAGADINASFTDLQGFGITALMFALERKCCTAMAAVLLQYGADPCVSVPESMTAMHAAARFRLSDTCELLLARADTLLEARDKFGRTALIYAASYGRADNAQILLQHGADVHAVNDKGSTALVFACVKEHMDVAASLLEAGADVNADVS
eukprot:7012-Heterococcus_DN1.PRE.1